MSAERIALLVCGLCAAVAAVAEDGESVDAAFLEYLGEWETTDDDWLLFEEVELTAATGQDEPAKKEEAESPEKEDES